MLTCLKVVLNVLIKKIKKMNNITGQTFKGLKDNIAPIKTEIFLCLNIKAVKHLHDHDLIHMDIKPENIFITDNEVCKLGDFGLVLDLSQVFFLLVNLYFMFFVSNAPITSLSHCLLYK